MQSGDQPHSPKDIGIRPVPSKHVRKPLQQAAPPLCTEGLLLTTPTSGRESHSFPEIRGTRDNITGNLASSTAVAIPAHVWEN